jgi:hypothetical protein
MIETDGDVLRRIADDLEHLANRLPDSSTKAGLIADARRLRDLTWVDNRVVMALPQYERHEP